MGFDAVKFRTDVIGLFKSMNPTIPVVLRNQNVAQPVTITANQPMMDIVIEKVRRRGSDYMIYNKTDDKDYWVGDREVVVELELFAPNALGIMCDFRDRLRTLAYRQKMRELMIMEKVSQEEPSDTTRIHGNSQYVESAVYPTVFHATSLVADTTTDIEQAPVTGTFNKG